MDERRLPRASRTAAAVCLFASALTLSPHATTAAGTAQGGASGTPVTTHTFLAAMPGRRDMPARFIVANWFEMDRVAVEQGLFRSYRLLQNPRTDEDWDLIVEVVYNDACGYPCVAERFEAVRAAHATVPVHGMEMNDLGRVVRSVDFQGRRDG
jgi:hypothetical protein